MLQERKMKIIPVNDHLVRNNFSPGFPVFSDSEPYIPKNQAWIDQAYLGELGHFLRIHEVGSRLPESLNFQEWRKAVCDTLVEKVSEIPNFVIKKEQNGLAIVEVDGRTIRKYLDPLFILGGHGFVYPYIPKDEIWIDTAQDRKEMGATLVHEKCERELMKQGLSYDFAHDYALVAERKFRKDRFGGR